MDTNTDTPTSTFTFPSGTTVELPAGMSRCATPEVVTYDCMRYVCVGTTPAGRKIWSHFSCAAYARAGHVFEMLQADAKLRARINDLTARGLTIKAGNLRRHTDEQKAQCDAAIADWTADPAPCTCPQ
jgi:hypothetical protein